MADFSLSTLRSVYITNQPYRYPIPWYKEQSSANTYAGDFASCVNTGWHILPNFLWGHIVSPKQWWEMMIQYEAIKVNSIHCRLFNPIPIQTALSFQANSTFPAFNNTVYALGYTDDIYETPWFDWWCRAYPGGSAEGIDEYYEWNPAFKEGLIQRPVTQVPVPPGTAVDRVNYDNNATQFPKDYFTRLTKEDTLYQQKLEFRRQFLPIYWYHFTFKQYRNKYNVDASWNNLSSNFEFAYSDVSGLFWDPLNRAEELMELRPGKNMIEYSWNVHESDAGIWFNTDRLASLTPYGRPRPLEVAPGSYNIAAKIRRTDPRGPGNFVNKVRYLKEMKLLKAGDQETVAGDIMAPESHMSLPDWRRWPIVPSRWFYKEIQESNPWALSDLTTRLYQKQQTGCPDMSKPTCSPGDVDITGPFQDTKFPGTEYEMHKYPPTQWFIKAVPLFDDGEKPIRVEMQMFMQITINLSGKGRRSAFYAPTWGPIEPMNLYSVNMDTMFGENFMRTRSGGARRTYYNPQEQEPWMETEGPPFLTNLYQYDSSSVSQVTVPHQAVDMCFNRANKGPTPLTPISHIYCNAARTKITLQDGKRHFTIDDSDSE